MSEKPEGLFIVATPIGNLEDMTFRGVEILASVDFILCEDTRKAAIIMNRFDIRNELVSFNARTEEKKAGHAIERIKNGESAALVSDAGTPSVSDPGARLVNLAYREGIKVTGIPGASAAVLALSISGLPSDSFIFEGFLPQKKGRQKKLKELADENRTIILYESVYRIEKLLGELNEYMPERMVAVARELTKKFEEVIRGLPGEILDSGAIGKIKGEFAVVIAPTGWKE